jgi:hypothetical protein
MGGKHELQVLLPPELNNEVIRPGTMYRHQVISNAKVALKMMKHHC